MTNLHVYSLYCGRSYEIYIATLQLKQFLRDFFLGQSSLTRKLKLHGMNFRAPVYHMLSRSTVSIIIIACVKMLVFH